MTLKHAIMQFNITMFSYLTIILRGRAGYELINNQRGAQRRVGYDYSYPASPSRIIVLLKTGLRIKTIIQFPKQIYCNISTIFQK